MNPASEYLMSLRLSSRVAQRYALKRALRLMGPGQSDSEGGRRWRMEAPIEPEQFPWHMLTVQQVERLQTELDAQNYSYSSKHTSLSAVRGALRCAKQMGLLTSANCDTLLAALRRKSKKGAR